MHWCTPTSLSLAALIWESNHATALHDLTLCVQILCPGMSLTCLNVHVTPRRQKSFTSPLVFHRPIQLLLSRLEITQLLHVIESKTLGTNLIAISLLKFISTTFFAPPHILFTTSERLRTFSPDLLQNVLSYQCICFFNTWISAAAFFRAFPPTS